MTVNYKGLYYIDFGEYPQSSIGASLPNPDETTLNSYTSYYEDSITGLKYAFKSPNYYLVEPVRWLVIGNGSGLNGKGFPDKNGNSGTDLTNNQLLLLSEKCIVTTKFNSTYQSATQWSDSDLYGFLLNMQNEIFSELEVDRLNDIDGHKLSLLSHTSIPFVYNHYNEPLTLLKSYATQFCGSVDYNEWYLRMNAYIGGNHYARCYGIRLNDGVADTSSMTENRRMVSHIRYVRPIIVLNV